MKRHEVLETLVILNESMVEISTAASPTEDFDLFHSFVTTSKWLMEKHGISHADVDEFYVAKQLERGIDDMRKPQSPNGPRLVREGTIGDCPKCHSTQLRKLVSRRVLGCINSRCENYHKNLNIN
jgi:hypothetical protein